MQNTTMNAIFISIFILALLSLFVWNTFLLRHMYHNFFIKDTHDILTFNQKLLKRTTANPTFISSLI